MWFSSLATGFLPLFTFSHSKYHVMHNMKIEREEKTREILWCQIQWLLEYDSWERSLWGILVFFSPMAVTSLSLFLFTLNLFSLFPLPQMYIHKQHVCMCVYFGQLLTYTLIHCEIINYVIFESYYELCTENRILSCRGNVVICFSKTTESII